jgi:hypothetical protein
MQLVINDKHVVCAQCGTCAGSLGRRLGSMGEQAEKGCKWLVQMTPRYRPSALQAMGRWFEPTCADGRFEQLCSVALASKWFGAEYQPDLVGNKCC